MQANLAKREPEMLAHWEQEQVYASVQQVGKDLKLDPYVFVDGPPYANGDIHIGHAVNKVLKDMIVKAARLNGHRAPFVPGWDCHGLPIELQVEKKFGKVGDKLDAKAFREKCREYANEQVARQREDFKRLGVLADWDKPYLTMQPAYEAEQISCLAKIVENGHVVRGFKPVHWCLDCGSSLAEAEVEYEDKKSFAIDVKFAAADAADLAQRFGISDAIGAALVIWTTTPWSLPGNQAVSVNAELDYALVDLAQHGRVVLAAELVERTAQRYKDEAKVVATTKGRTLEGLKVRHPFAERNVPVICGEHVTLEAGTGLVHTAPAHGVDDYVVGKQYKLPVDNPVASNGKFIEGTPLVAGVFVRKADELIIEGLRQNGALAHLAEITHSYPHCWRHKTPLIQRATPQWFISMDAKGLRGDALKAIGQTRWIPAWGENRIKEMVAGRPDWCISRQRTWGVPMAVFVHREKQELHPDSAALLKHIAAKVEKEGLEAWFGSTPADWGVDEVAYEKCTDTLDVWFDSGVAHQASFVSTGQIAAGGNAPVADMYLEGSDQHRGWFQSSLLTSVAMHGRAPYKAVLTHGFTVDEQGRKMSKSLGNVVAPQQVTKTLGADVLRLWVAASDYSGEIAISDNLLKRVADAYRRIRNTTRYLLGSLNGFDPATDTVPVEQMLAMDRWAVQQAAKLQDEIRKAYDNSEFHLVYQKLHNYCVNDLGGLYLDVLKDRLYTLPAKSAARRSAQTALLHIAEAMVRWITPILSFTADEIWQLLPGDRKASVFAQTWHQFPAEAKKTGIDWKLLSELREKVKGGLEQLRAVDKVIGSALQAEIDITCESNSLLGQQLTSVGDELRFWFITSSVTTHISDQSLSELWNMDSAGRSDIISLGNEKAFVKFTVSQHAKCDRCWHHRADVGSYPEDPTLCGRCVDNVSGAGETRRYF